MKPDLKSAAVDLVKRSTQVQGIPRKATAETLARVAALLGNIKEKKSDG
jgi:hypothetical protein